MIGAFKSLVARVIPFDNSTNGFTAENVQEAIEENKGSSSPTLLFTRRGVVDVNDWLLLGEVSSNRTGSRNLLDDAEIVRVTIDNDRTTTFSITFYEHDGFLANLNTLGTLTVTSAIGDVFDLNFPISDDRQIAARMTSFTGQRPRNVVVQVVPKGGT